MVIRELWKPEFYDVNYVLENGATKYAKDSWLIPSNKSFEGPANHDSMFHHLARDFVYKELKDDIEEIERELKRNRYSATSPLRFYLQALIHKLKRDHESGLHHTLHLSCRAVMQYTRYKRNID